MGHNHTGMKISRTQIASTTSKTTRIVVTGLLVIVVALTIAGMAWLRPDWKSLEKIRHLSNGFSTAKGVSFENAEISHISHHCRKIPADSTNPDIPPGDCLRIRIRLLSGPDKGHHATIESVGPAASSSLSPGDTIQVMRSATFEGDSNDYSYVGVHRSYQIIFFSVIFSLVVLAVARWKGFLSLLGLIFATLIIGFFMIPALACGHRGIWVGLVASSAIMLVVVHMAHGFSMRTAAAMLGTISGLVLCAIFGVAAVWLGHLSGYVDDTSFDLNATIPKLDMRQLLVAAIILSGLGVLNDLTITQASSVWELRIAAPHYSRLDIYRSAMRIGRDHIASTIYTIVFAYTGATLATVMLVVTFYNRPVSEIFATESISAQIVQILASSSALILSLPITTAIAASMVRKETPLTPDAILEQTKQKETIPLKPKHLSDRPATDENKPDAPEGYTENPAAQD